MAWRNRQNSIVKAKLNIEATFIKSLAIAVLSDNPLITKPFIGSVNEFCNQVELEDEVYEIREIYDIVRKYSELIMNGIIQRNVIITNLLDQNPEYSSTIQTLLNEVISDNDIIYVSERLRNLKDKAYMDSSVQLFKEIIDIHEDPNSDIREESNKLNEVRESLKVLNNSQVILTQSSKSDIIIEPGLKLTNALSELQSTRNKRGHFVKTGIRGIDALLPRGLECQTVLTIIAPSANGKSLSMLEIAKNMAYKNKFEVVERRQPIITYISMENTQSQTLTRLAQSITGKNIDEFDDPVELSNTLSGYFTNSKFGNAKVQVLYRPNKTLNSNAIASILETNKKEGYETKALFVDYIGRMIDNQCSKTDRSDIIVGNIVNELKDLAIEFEIPVITAGQVNESGLQAVNSSISSYTRTKSASLRDNHVAEGKTIINNSDYVLFLARDMFTDDNGNLLNYAGFTIWKDRQGGAKESSAMIKVINNSYYDDKEYVDPNATPDLPKPSSNVPHNKSMDLSNCVKKRDLLCGMNGVKINEPDDEFDKKINILENIPDVNM